MKTWSEKSCFVTCFQSWKIVADFVFEPMALEEGSSFAVVVHPRLLATHSIVAALVLVAVVWCLGY